MASSTFTKFHCLTQDLARGVHNWTPSTGDTLKVYLTTTTPNPSTHGSKVDLSETVVTGNGYTATGASLVVNALSVQTAGLFKLVIDDPPVWEATGAGFGPLRYAVVYNSSKPNSPLIGFFDYSSAIFVLAGESFTLDFSSTSGILQIA